MPVDGKTSRRKWHFSVPFAMVVEKHFSRGLDRCCLPKKYFVIRRCGRKLSRKAGSKAGQKAAPRAEWRENVLRSGGFSALVSALCRIGPIKRSPLVP